MNRFVGLIVTAALLAMPVSAYALTLKKGETLGSDGMVQGAGWGIYGANTSGLKRLFTNPESPDLKKHWRKAATCCLWKQIGKTRKNSKKF